jgi:hypothetical protein
MEVMMIVFVTMWESLTVIVAVNSDYDDRADF